MQAHILKAELHYLNGNIDAAQTEYLVSIKAAHEHKYLHYEALAYELHGMFLIENSMPDEGVGQLKVALDKYKLWGANRKVKELEDFMDVIDPTHLRSKLKVRI